MDYVNSYRDLVGDYFNVKAKERKKYPANKD